MNRPDAIVIGAGPNGLSAAIALARAGVGASVFERSGIIGGGLRSGELTLPGFIHDHCSTVQALACASPFFRQLPLADCGARMVHPEIPLAHPLDDGSAVACERSVDDTARSLAEDGDAYRRLVGQTVADWDQLAPMILAPTQWPAHPIVMGRFGLRAIRSAVALAEGAFAGQRARALFAGAAAHSVVPLEWAGSAAFGLVLLGSAHAVGWPVVQGGSQRLADALAHHLRSLGGEIHTGTEVRSIDDLPPARAILCDVSPRQLIGMAGDRLPRRYVHTLERFRHGPGVFKLDWALAAPIPWRAEACRRAGTVHVGGTLDEIAASERACWAGEHADRPFVLLVQPTLFDPTRAPPVRHVAWAYCHVPSGSTVDMTERIERQIERFAPGFADTILARSKMNCRDMERENPNLIAGDITGGANTLWQTFFRPRLFPSPYSTPIPGLYLCSASTPPGGGVHGMCGFHAAQTALAWLRNIEH